MTDFWFNHFNIYLHKDADQYLVTAYERDVIRPHALGKFKDLLLATAQSPAMLFYLDNWLSMGPKSLRPRRGQSSPARGHPDSTKTTAASSWSCTLSASTAVTRSMM